MFAMQISQDNLMLAASRGETQLNPSEARFVQRIASNDATLQVLKLKDGAITQDSTDVVDRVIAALMCNTQVFVLGSMCCMQCELSAECCMPCNAKCVASCVVPSQSLSALNVQVRVLYFQGFRIGMQDAQLGNVRSM